MDETNNVRAQGWIDGAINPLLQALEGERLRLALDSSERDAGNIGFRWEAPALKYVGHLGAYLNWDRREIFRDWLEAAGAPFKPVADPHDAGIDRLYEACRVAHAALREHDAPRTLMRPIDAAMAPAPVPDDGYSIAAERVINNTKYLGALIGGAGDWSKVADKVFAAVGEVKEYQSLLAARSLSLQTCEEAETSLRQLRRALADQFQVEVAFSGSP